MALTYTPEPELGSSCPDFQLVGVDGEQYSLAKVRGSNALLIMFICNHCPYVQAIEDRLIELAKAVDTRCKNARDLLKRFGKLSCRFICCNEGAGRSKELFVSISS